jgi:hypothetical protein
VCRGRGQTNNLHRILTHRRHAMRVAASVINKEFDDQHIQYGPPVTFDGRVFFGDGAWREVSQFGMAGVSMGPHHDPRQRTRDILNYHKLRVREATKKFNELHAAVAEELKHFAERGIMPPANYPKLEELRQLKEEVRVRQEALDAKQLEADGGAEVVAQREAAAQWRAGQQAQAHARCTELMDEVKQIKI